MAEAKAEAVSDDNSRATFISFLGATGPHADTVNGTFEASQQKSEDGRMVYIKRGDRNCCIEHSNCRWHVKPASHKGKVGCWAYVAGGCALEACGSCVWSVHDGSAFAAQPGVKMLMTVDAGREVSCQCIQILPLFCTLIQH
jgi:hypothetical protein